MRYHFVLGSGGVLCNSGFRWVEKAKVNRPNCYGSRNNSCSAAADKAMPLANLKVVLRSNLKLANLHGAGDKDAVA